MIEWKKGVPTGAIIVAKLTDRFCGSDKYYTVLTVNPLPYRHYVDEDGEEVPLEAIEEWEIIA